MNPELLGEDGIFDWRPILSFLLSSKFTGHFTPHQMFQKSWIRSNPALLQNIIEAGCRGLGPRVSAFVPPRNVPEHIVKFAFIIHLANVLA